MPEDDPRIYFAAERTLLAWLRTALAVIGLGFIVARFGLFLRALRNPGAVAAPSLPSTIIGVTLVIIGAAITALAAVQHIRFTRELSPAQRPARYWVSFGIAVSFALCASGILLAVYLMISA
jgi:putative membrane protein